MADLPAERQGCRSDKYRKRRSVQGFKEILKMFRGVAEWSNAAVLKTVVPRGTGGSNPSSSANQSLLCKQRAFFIYEATELALVVE